MKTKKELRFFSNADYGREQIYLRFMHGLGWKFVKTAGLGIYCFERCEPADVIYRLDSYMGVKTQTQPAGTCSMCEWSGRTSPHAVGVTQQTAAQKEQDAAASEAYVRELAKSGWEFLGQYMEFGYFRRPASEADDGELVDRDEFDFLMRQSFKTRLLRLLLGFVCFAALLIVNCISHYTALVVVYGVFTAAYLILFADLAVKYYRYFSHR